MHLPGTLHKGLLPQPMVIASSRSQQPDMGIYAGHSTTSSVEEGDPNPEQSSHRGDSQVREPLYEWEESAEGALRRGAILKDDKEEFKPAARKTESETYVTETTAKPELISLHTATSEQDDPLGVLHKIDDIINRLMYSCKQKPEQFSAPVHHSKDPVDPRVLEQRLESIIKRLSQRGELEISEKCKSYASPIAIPGAAGRFDSGEKDDPGTPTMLKLSSKSCGSAEKIAALASPTSRSPSGRSGRFMSALSFLASPRRASGFTGFRLGSPSQRTPDGYIDR